MATHVVRKTIVTGILTSRLKATGPKPGMWIARTTHSNSIVPTDSCIKIV
jgi:hypothetical protein